MRLESRRTFTIGACVLYTIFAATLIAPSQAAARQYRAVPNGQRTMVASRPHSNRVRPVETRNFVVYANDEVLARKVSVEAERFRRELAIQWLGKEIPGWRDKCPITVEVGRNAGGETSFAFDRPGKGMPIDWKMRIFGPPNRILDAVLPHEITHTIFATHFGRPLPRWADEGACTTVEHESERKKNHKMLLEFLRSKPSRGIPFNRMFTMRNYPHDILPLYAQGYSLARFLIMKKGRRHFVDFISAGLRNESRYQEFRAWDLATSEYYGYKDLSDLQIQWLGWVKGGSKASEDKLAQPKIGELAALSNVPDSRIPSSVYGQGADSLGAKRSQAAGQVGLASFVESPSTTMESRRLNAIAPAVSPQQKTYANSSQGSWYAKQMEKGSQIANTQTVRSSNQTRKVPATNEKKSPPPVANDSRLPEQYGVVQATLWR